MDRWAGKVAVVTGASAGIGLATSIALVREGMIVVGLARRKAVMEGAVKAATKGAKGKFHGLECDVTNEQKVIEVFRTIKKNIGAVHVLVNNAGVLITGSILETTSEDWKKTFDINVMGLLYCTKEALKSMKESKIEAHVVNINSLHGHRVYVFGELKTNVYPASKHAVTAITESLIRENMGDKIRFTSISPGFVKTAMTEGDNYPAEVLAMPGIQAEDVANAIVYVIGTPHRVQVHELTIRPLGEQTS